MGDVSGASLHERSTDRRVDGSPKPRKAVSSVGRVADEYSGEPRLSRIDIFWIPLGAGGNGFVRWNGRIYEAIRARAEHRTRLQLYHTALEVHVPEGRFVVENAWPSPDDDTASRGVTVEGPVFSRRLMRFRAFRYEVRCWRDGVIVDAAEAVPGPQTVQADPNTARALLERVSDVPPLLWGRQPPGVGEMWNSNSVIAWLLATSGLPVVELGPPEGGRAPGWRAGLAVAAR